jgi:SAM-dependent methyltransferase
MHTATARTTCRFCGAPLIHSFADLGMQPPCESFLPAEAVNDLEPTFPLHAMVCGECRLVQLNTDVAPDSIYTEYAYFSSYSSSWLQHAKDYSEMIIGRLGLNANSMVVELASNDGYLLQNFVIRGIPAYGIDPAANVAAAAEARGVRTMVDFFGVETAHRLVRENQGADLIAANNVFGHVPDINDFVGGMKILLKSGGTITIEIPHLLHLIEDAEFDTIYHEHYCYWSGLTAATVFAKHGLRLFDIDTLATHGGSMRMYVCHADDARPQSAAIDAFFARERAHGLDKIATYTAFGERAKQAKRDLLSFLIETKRAGKSIAGYGAPGKGNTLLNYCGIRTDFLDYVVDRNPYKHGRFLPGSHIPIFAPEKLAETRPDVILILPWNLKTEITKQLAYTREWGARLYVPIPKASEVV